jgi:ComEC/Rec2-related protein
MMVEWISGFIAGILLGKHLAFPYLQNITPLVTTGIILIPGVMLLTGRRSKIIVVSCAMLWGSLHAAPDYVGPCREFSAVRTNLLQRAKGPAVVAVDGLTYEVVIKPESAAVGGYVAGSGFTSPRTLSLHCKVRDRPPESAHPWVVALLDRYFRLGGSAQLVAWMETSVFGFRGDLEHRIQRHFRSTGLIHLLVVSGLHVGLFALFCRLILLLPFLPAYSLTLISPAGWRRVHYLGEAASIPLVCAYVWLIGAPGAAQRAAAFYVLWVMCKLFFGVRRPTSRFQICLLAQTLIFPVGFFAAGNIMSWVATLMLVSRRPGSEGVWTDLSVLLDLRLQLQIMAVAGALFGEMTPLSLPANLLLAPVFGLILQLSYLNLLLPLPALTFICGEFVQIWLGMIEQLANLPDIAGGSWLRQRPVSTSVRVGLVLIVLYLILNSLRDLTIRIPDD